MDNQDYQPFGEEWKKEIAKFPKAEIIKMLSEVKISLKETSDLLLKATKNLGHPAYGHSFHTTTEIDGFREKCFNFLGVAIP